MMLERRHDESRVAAHFLHLQRSFPMNVDIPDNFTLFRPQRNNFPCGHHFLNTMF